MRPPKIRLLGKIIDPLHPTRPAGRLLNDKQVRDIRRMYEESARKSARGEGRRLAYLDFAQKYGVSEQTIHNVVRRKGLYGRVK